VEAKGTIIGAEGLLRWNHPERGVLAPMIFLPVAEETGLMPEIGQWVLSHACSLIKEWTDGGYLPGEEVISVNISGRELSEPGFVERLTAIVEETGADPARLGIELTEGSLVSNTADIVAKILALQELGIKFSIDDFGTGYSSLSYLNRLPINTLKIDRSFVTEISASGANVILVDTIIQMAKSLGLEIIAEGVESELELDYLSKRGCHIYQGYYFSAPIPEEDFSSMLAAPSRWSASDSE
jgi:EAL domain-containing protein (putative c-di-GMP-specific phosphodiesterase class I)